MGYAVSALLFVEMPSRCAIGPTSRASHQDALCGTSVGPVAYITDLIVIKNEVDQIEEEPAFMVNRMPPLPHKTLDGDKFVVDGPRRRPPGAVSAT